MTSWSVSRSSHRQLPAACPHRPRDIVNSRPRVLIPFASGRYVSKLSSTPPSVCCSLSAMSAGDYELDDLAQRNAIPEDEDEDEPQPSTDGPKDDGVITMWAWASAGL